MIGMAPSTAAVRRVFASLSVAILLGLQVALFISAHLLNELGFEAISDDLGIVIDVAIAGIVVVSQLIPWSLVPEVSLSGLAISATVLAAYLVVYYAIAVVAAVPGRSVYRFISRKSL